MKIWFSSECLSNTHKESPGFISSTHAAPHIPHHHSHQTHTTCTPTYHQHQHHHQTQIRIVSTLKKWGAGLLRFLEPGHALWEASPILPLTLLTSGCSGAQMGCSLLQGWGWGPQTQRTRLLKGKLAGKIDAAGSPHSILLEEDTTQSSACSPLVTEVCPAWSNGGRPTFQGSLLLLPPQPILTLALGSRSHS